MLKQYIVELEDPSLLTTEDVSGAVSILIETDKAKQAFKIPTYETLDSNKMHVTLKKREIT